MPMPIPAVHVGIGALMGTAILHTGDQERSPKRAQSNKTTTAEENKTRHAAVASLAINKVRAAAPYAPLSLFFVVRGNKGGRLGVPPPASDLFGLLWLASDIPLL
jgi:hypothetical protein